MALVLNSYPSATAQISLVFNDPVAWHNNAPYTDEAGQREIWGAVAEAYSPFNINVTTVPLDNAAKVIETVVICGNSSWTFNQQGGHAYIGSFADGTGGTYVFPEDLSNNPHYIGLGAIHEAGHAFGLFHHADYDANGNKTNEYSAGNSLVAPIMGVAYNSRRALWENAPQDTMFPVLQDDLAVISSATNGFGYRPQDHGQTFATAETLTGNVSGVVEQTTDQDTFLIHFQGGELDASLNSAQFGPMLNGKLELYGSDKNLIYTAATPDSFMQNIAMNVQPGDYYLVVKSFGGYGDLGQYSLQTNATPEPSLLPFFVLCILGVRRRKHN
jgi:hypothetical protein